MEDYELLHVFVRGGKTGAIYWSRYDPADATGYAQTFWRAVPSLGNAAEAFGRPLVAS